MDRLLCFIWLNALDISPSKKLRLLDFFGNCEAVYRAGRSEYSEADFLSADNITLLMNKQLSFAESEYEGCLKSGIKLIPAGSDSFPPALKEIPDPPILLYAKGDVSLLQNRLAFCFVGSRQCTDYGTSNTMKFASQLAQAGFVIVSGGAMGIDSAAHKGALIARGKTVAVMGCGLSVDYPSGNRALRKEIAEKGLLISEFPLTTPAHGYNFPRRNRLLSGLSLGVAVMEAGAHSGALITAEYAIQQNRDAYAMPGNIDSVCSAGCNELIRDGCEMLTDADRIIGEYLSRYTESFVPENASVEPVSDTVKKVLRQINEGSTADERAVIRLLRHGEQHIDSIISSVGLPPSRVTSLLTVMQIKGIIREETGKYFKLN